MREPQDYANDECSACDDSQAKKRKGELPCGCSPSLSDVRRSGSAPDHNDLHFQVGKELQALRPRFLYLPSSLPLYEPSQFHPSASSFLNALLSSVAGSPDFPSFALFYWKISPPLIWILGADRSRR
jgi:hypothetical protein